MTYVTIGSRRVAVGAALDPFERATALPREFYLEQAIYELEELRVMRAHWLPLARVEEVSRPGDFVSKELLGDQLVVAHDLVGDIRVLSNVCRHRGMPLVDGSGNSRLLRCPYHLWTYHLDGALSGAPLMGQSFDRTSVCLPVIRHEIWNGWIMVNLDGCAGSLGERLGRLSQSLSDWGFDRLVLAGSRTYDCDWNWKIIIDNFSEYYHHLGLHRESLEPFLPAREGSCLENSGEPWSSSTIGCSSDYVSLQGTSMSGLDDTRSREMQVFNVFPLLCAGAQPSSAFWMQVQPKGVARTIVTWHVLVRPERIDAPDLRVFVEDSLRAIDVLQSEDSAACRGVQAGIRSTTYSPGMFAPLELPIWQLQRWLLHRLAEDTARLRED